MAHSSSRQEDLAGHRGEIVTGGVQWMCAGRGIIHAEMPVCGPGIPDPQGLQLWIDLPKEHKMMEPTYQELGPSEIPSAFSEGPEGPIEIKVISGKSHSVDSPVHPQGSCWYFHIKFRKVGSMFQDIHEFNSIAHAISHTSAYIAVGWTAFIYTMKGNLIVNVGSSSLKEEPFHTLVLSSGQNETGVALPKMKLKLSSPNGLSIWAFR
ncbi:RmlC-like cupin domain-containing protein [Hysterangium stoloniferum]|nr:RmlC-like cupin domain-containing protein [Hysterangium stoloniferum]